MHLALAGITVESYHSGGDMAIEYGEEGLVGFLGLRSVGVIDDSAGMKDRTGDREMKQIVILSGKGGSSKMAVATALAHLASQENPIVLADADVDTCNLKLVLTPRPLEAHDFTREQMDTVDQGRNRGCAFCLGVCPFTAIGISPGRRSGREFPAGDPHGPAGCVSCLCRFLVGGVSMGNDVVGRWFQSDTRFGPLLHAQLFAGRENSSKLVRLVKQKARELGQAEGREFLLINGPGGMGCSAIAACSGVDLALLVVEPTAAGFYDLKQVTAVLRYLGVPSLVCLNKHDLDALRTDQMERLCSSMGVMVVGRIPFNNVIIRSMVHGKTITEYSSNTVSRNIEQIWAWIKAILGSR